MSAFLKRSGFLGTVLLTLLTLVAANAFADHSGATITLMDPNPVGTGEVLNVTVSMDLTDGTDFFGDPFTDTWESTQLWICPVTGDCDLSFFDQNDWTTLGACDDSVSFASVTSPAMHTTSVDMTPEALDVGDYLVGFLTHHDDGCQTPALDGLFSAPQVLEVEEADVSVVKDAVPATVIPGTAFEYHITVANAGPSDAPQVTVTDNFPNNAVDCTWLAALNGGAAGGGSGSGDISEVVSLPAGADIVYTVSCDMPSAARNGVMDNTATANDANVYDPNTANNSDDGPITKERQADLSVVKTASVTEIAPGESFTYQIVADNAGPSDVNDAIITDSFAPNAVCTWTATPSAANADGNAPEGFTPGPAEGDINESGVTLPAGTNITYDANCTVNADAEDGTMPNQAVISSSEIEINGENNSSDWDIQKIRRSELTITKVGSASPVIAGGDEFTYTIEVTNSGPSYADNVTVTDTLPDGITFVSTTGCAEDDAGYPTCNLGTLGVAADGNNIASYTMTVKADATVKHATTLTNSASVVSDSTEDNPDDNTATEDTLVNRLTDLTITKIGPIVRVTAGGAACDYVITVSNAGPSYAENVTVNDTLPDGLTFVSSTGCVESTAGGVPVCTIPGEIANGGEAVYTVTVTADADVDHEAPLTNLVVAATTDPESDTNNNSDSENTIVHRLTDLTITKVGPTDPVVAGGDEFTYTIEVFNAGPSNAAASVTDTLPAGFTFVSTTGCVESTAGGYPMCTIGEIEPQGSASYTLTVSADSNVADGVTLTNTAEAITLDPESDLTNNVATADTDVIRLSDLTISKDGDVDEIVAGGDPVVYTIEVTNDGPSDADNVIVTDTLPAELTLISTTGCAEDPTGVPTCSLGTMVAGAVASYTVTAQAKVDTEHDTLVTNLVSVDSDSDDPDETNNDDDEDTNIITEAYWDVTKSWNRGGTGSVSITLTCDGIAPVSGVANPGVPTTLTATGWDNGATSCLVTEDVPGGTFEEYSVDCSVSNVVSATTYICEIGNSEAFATFAVRKRFMDGNDVTPVTFHMDCNNGLPTEQQLTVIPDTGDFDRGSYEVNFVVTKFAPGQMDCTVYEEPVAGYTASYVCGSNNNPGQVCTDGDRSPLDNFGTGPCHFEDVDSSGAYDSINFCTIRNYPNPGTITITKDWIVEGAGGNLLDLEANVEIISSAEVAGSYPCQGNKWCTSVNFYGPATMSHTLDVETSFTGTSVRLSEHLYDNTFLSENDCGGTLTVYPAGYAGDDGAENCTFTNTAFFEGIPTLNQYGMAILVLLTLGIGLVGFRRFS